MIAVKLTGGLGNQLFQYAAGLATARRNNTELRLDKRAFVRARTDRQYALSCFVLDDLHRDVDPAQVGGRPVQKIIERQFHHNPELLQAFTGDIWMRGYWQSEKYFASHVALLRDKLRWKSPIPGRTARLQHRISHERSVALHVRRGDYLTDPATTAVHRVLPMSYYQHACEVMHQAIGSYTTFVFTDDVSWCAERLSEFPNAVLVSKETGGDASEDLRLMHGCQHQIIANSTFSWWGAWLNPNPGKKVIAPAKWFRTPDINTSDLLPAAWVKLTDSFKREVTIKPQSAQ